MTKKRIADTTNRLDFQVKYRTKRDRVRAQIFAAHILNVFIPSQAGRGNKITLLHLMARYRGTHSAQIRGCKSLEAIMEILGLDMDLADNGGYTDDDKLIYGFDVHGNDAGDYAFIRARWQLFADYLKTSECKAYE